MEEYDDLAHRRFHADRRVLRVWVSAILVNALLLAGGLLGPWLRGRMRAEDAQVRFARYAACLWGGRPAARPGLGLPAGGREHYATLVLSADEEWPERCREPLGRVAPEEATILFPGVKGAEAQVREAVARVDTELLGLAELRRSGFDHGGVGRIPERPLLATGRLLAALSVWARETGQRVDEQAVAFELTAAVEVVEPARVPLSAASSARVQITARADGIEATAVGGPSVSWVRVGGGRVDYRRIRRPGPVRELVPGPGGPWAVWATPRSRCEGTEAGCAQRSTGVGYPFAEGADSEQPRWLGAHPAYAVADSVRVGEGVAWVLAEGSGAEPAELRRFALPATSVRGGRDGEARAAILPAERRWALEGLGRGDTARLLGQDPPLLLWSLALDEGGRAFHVLSPGGEGPAVELGRVAGKRPRLLTCEAGSGWTVLLEAGAGGGVLVRLAPNGVPQGSLELLRLPGQALNGPNTRRLACDEGHVHVLGVDAAGTLGAVRCVWDEARCGEPFTVARRVVDFDAARDDGTTLVAWNGGPDDALVRVTRLDTGAAPTTTVHAACWSPDAGFCGPASFSARNGRFLLATREGPDLRVIESVDAGRSFRPMRGVR